MQLEPQIVELPITHKTTKINSKKKSKKCSGNCRKCRSKRKIIGDSHAKGSAADIKQVLGKSAVLIGYVSTGVKLNYLTSMANNEINKLTKKRCCGNLGWSHGYCKE